MGFGAKLLFGTSPERQRKRLEAPALIPYLWLVGNGGVVVIVVLIRVQGWFEV